jgi:hypothetical protein
MHASRVKVGLTPFLDRSKVSFAFSGAHDEHRFAVKERDMVCVKASPS